MYRYLDAVMLRAAVSRPDEHLEAELPGLFADTFDPAEWREWLAQTLDEDNPFARAVEHASPALMAQARAVRDARPMSERKARRVVLALLRYRLRSCSRATPFGLFAGVAAARLAPVATVRIGQEHLPRLRRNGPALAAQIDRLETDPQILPHLRVQASDLLRYQGDQAVLTYRSDADGGEPGSAHVTMSAQVRAVLQATHQPVAAQKLIIDIAAQFTADISTVSQLISQMLAQRILVSDLRPTMFDTAPEQTLARSLSTANIPAPQTPVEGIDLHLDADVSIPQAVAAEAARAADVLTRLAVPDPVGWRDWHARFLERYSLHTLVPLLEVVDDAVGLGFPASFRGGPPIAATGVSERDRKLVALAGQAALHQQLVVDLDEATIDELAVDAPNTATTAVEGSFVPVQPSTELIVQVSAATPQALSDGNFELAIIGDGRCAGSTSGRFLDLLPPADQARFAAHYASAPRVTSNAILAQVSTVGPYRSTDVVARTPQVLPHVISLGQFTEDPPDEQTGSPLERIPLQDLGVMADRDRLYLISRSRRCVVQPVVLNAVSAVWFTMPLVRFLTEVGTAFTRPCKPFNWGPAARALPFLPGLRTGRTLLVPPRWRLTSTDLPTAASTKTWCEALSSWRRVVACPRWVYLGDSDQRIRLDLDNAAHAAVLHDQLARSPAVILRAAGDPDGDGWIGRAHELVIPLASTEPPLPSPQIPVSVLRPQDHGHPPGLTNQAYIKIYAPHDRLNLILLHHIPDLINRLHAPRWWFQRYQDTAAGTHLRVRLLHQDPPTDVRNWPDEPNDSGRRQSSDRAVLGQWALHLRRHGLSARIALDTDYPEINRFGGPGTIDAVTNFFAADSAAVVAELNAVAAARQRLDVRAITAASLLDIASSLLGDHHAGMTWLIEHASTSKEAPPRSVFEQAVQLARPDNRAAVIGLPHGQDIEAAWAERARSLTTFRHAFQQATAAHPDTTRGIDSILADFLHLHHTRLAGPDPHHERTCLHLARAAALSWTSRPSSVRRTA